MQEFMLSFYQNIEKFAKRDGLFANHSKEQLEAKQGQHFLILEIDRPSENIVKVYDPKN